MYKKIISIMSVVLMVFLCSSFSVSAASNGPVQRIGVRSDIFTPTGGDSVVYASLSLTSYPIQYGGGANFNYATCEVLGYLVVFNNNDQDLKMTGNKFYYYIQQANPAYNVYQSSNTKNWSLVDVEYLGGQLNISYITNQNLFVFEKYNDDHLGEPTQIIIPANSNVCCYFKLSYYVQETSTVGSYNNPGFTTSTVYLANTDTGYYGGTLGNYYENYYSYIPDMYDVLLDIYSREGTISNQLQQILQAYNSNVPASQNVTQDASDSSNVIGNQHQQEASIYSQTNQAIGNSGIQEFQFDSQTIGGLGGVKNDFMTVWNSLGTFNSIFVTSLTIGLALSIVRHRRMFKQ